MRILIVTDAWHPQVNGVVRTLEAVAEKLRLRGHEARFITPQGRRTVPLPSYREIGLTLTTAAAIGREIKQALPDAVHIATEGPLGWAARKASLRAGLPFTTGFHSRFAEYAAARVPVPGIGALGWAVLRRFHAPSHGVMVPTPSIANELDQRGFSNLRVWSRGVDHSLFRPCDHSYLDLPRPILIYVGRLAVEKGIGDFLKIKTPGTKVVVGEGPQRQQLQAVFRGTVFTGLRQGEELVRTLASADVLVFPSRTDTFGLVMLEAMACGTPVAAYDVPSPIDVVEEGITGSLNRDLTVAVEKALSLDRAKVHAAAQRFTWERVAELFESWLVPTNGRQADGSPKAVPG